MKKLTFLLVLMLSGIAVGQTCDGFRMSGLKCKNKVTWDKHCELHQYQQHDYSRFTKSVDASIVNQHIRVYEFDIEGLKKSKADKLAETIKISDIDTVNLTNNGLELAFGNFNEYKKHYLKHIHIAPVEGKAGYVKVILSYAKREKWM